MAREFALDALAQAADDLVLFERREADQHRDAIAEQGDEPVLAGPEGEGSRGEDVAALETRQFEAVAQKKGAGGHALVLHRRAGRGERLGHGHATKIGCAT